VALACVLWLMFGYQHEQIRREFILPIAYTNLAPDLVIEAPQDAQAKAILVGSQQAFQFLRAEALKITIDLGQMEKGHQKFLITRDMMNLPPNIAVGAISPAEITVVASRVATVSVPVEVVTENAPPPGRFVQSIAAVPREVRMQAPRKMPPESIHVRTAPIDLRAFPATGTVTAQLAYAPELRFVEGTPPTVRVTVKIRRKLPLPHLRR
jgi:hypothetical protein